MNFDMKENIPSILFHGVNIKHITRNISPFATAYQNFDMTILKYDKDFVCMPICIL
jgi:hypothetical protein